MEEQLELIKSGLFKSEITFEPLKEKLLQSGEIKAWYKYYRGFNPWGQKFGMDENIYLTDKTILISQIYEDGEMRIFTYRLDDISAITREYSYTDKKKTQLHLSAIEFTLKGMKTARKRDILLLKRPVKEEMGDAEGFEKFCALLD
jgi:hypothetical protein